MRDTEIQTEIQAEGEQAPRGDPDAGLHPTTSGSCPKPKADAQPLSHPGTPNFPFLTLPNIQQRTDVNKWKLTQVPIRNPQNYLYVHQFISFFSYLKKYLQLCCELIDFHLLRNFPHFRFFPVFSLSLFNSQWHDSIDTILTHIILIKTK